MKAKEKFQKIFIHKPPQKIPRTLWKHHPKEEENLEEFVKATLDFHAPHNFDVVKITPGSAFCIRDYGCHTTSHGTIYGNVVYRPALTNVNTWSQLEPQDAAKGLLGIHVEATKLISKRISSSQLLLHTIFSPLAQAINLVGLDLALEKAESSPSCLWHVIQTIAITTKQFIDLIEPYVDGFCYAIQESPHLKRFPEVFLKEYHKMNTEILERNDLIKMLHLHGVISDDFSSFCRYPIDILHWDEKISGISLQQGKDLFSGIISGGVDWPEKGWHSPEEVSWACKLACNRIGNDRFLLSAGCVIPQHTHVDMIDAFSIQPRNCRI